MFDIISSSIIVLLHHMLHEGNKNIKLILNEISKKKPCKQCQIFYFPLLGRPLLCMKDSVLDQGEGPRVHAPSLIYLKEKKKQTNNKHQYTKQCYGDYVH